MNEQEILHKKETTLLKADFDGSKKREFFISLFEGKIEFSRKQGSVTTTVFDLTSKEFIEIAEKLKNKGY